MKPISLERPGGSQSNTIKGTANHVEKCIQTENRILKDLLMLVEQNRFSKNPIWMKDRKGMFLFANSAFEEKILSNIGKTLDQCVGYNVHDLYPVDAAKLAIQKNIEAIESGEMDLSIHPDLAGRLITWFVLKVPVVLQSGEIIVTSIALAKHGVRTSYQ